MRYKYASYQEINEAVKVFEETLASDSFKNSDDDDLTRMNVLKSGDRGLFDSTDYFLTQASRWIPGSYSRGDSMDDIAKRYADIVIRRYAFLSSELAKGHPQKYIYSDWGEGNICPKTIHNIYTVLSWMICLGTTPQQLAEIVPYLTIAGYDRLLDIVCGTYQADREIATTCSHPDKLGFLFDVISADDEKRQGLILLYLNNWHKTITAIDDRFIGLHLTNTNVMPRTFYQLVNVNRSSEGAWAWEVALLVKILHIDDSVFKDHDLYPYDLVHFTPPLDNHAYLDSLNLQGSDMKPISSYTRKRDDLTITLDIDADLFKSTLVLGSEAPHWQRFYSAHRLQQASLNDPNADSVSDSDLRYSAYIETEANCVDHLKERYLDTLCYKYCAEYCLGYEDFTANDFVDKFRGEFEVPSAEEMYFFIAGEQDHYSYIYGSRHPKNKHKPLMILSYRKAINDTVLCIDCMVRDETITVKDVFTHWDWLIDEVNGHLDSYAAICRLINIMSLLKNKATSI